MTADRPCPAATATAAPARAAIASLARRNATTSSAHGSSLLLAGLALILALGIYSFYRCADTRVNVLAALLPGDAWQSLRLAVPERLHLAAFAKGALPGGLWVFAATLIAQGVVAGVGALRMNMALLPVITALFFEWLQWAGVTDGTFDPVDIVAEAGGWTLALLWIARRGPSAHGTPTQHWRLALCLLSYAILPLADVRR